MDAILIDGDTTDDVSFYEVVSEIKLESSGADDSIKVKKIKETFLVEAKDIIDAKTSVDKLYRKGVGISSDYEIVLIKKSRIVEVINQETQDLKELPEGKWLTKKIEKETAEDIQDEEPEA
jgi:hypothetical protein